METFHGTSTRLCADGAYGLRQSCSETFHGTSLLAYAPAAHTARLLARLCADGAYGLLVCLRMPCRRLEAWRGRDARLPAPVLIHQVKARLLAVARRFKDEIAPVGRP